MKTLIVYDSLYGNTEKIAQAIGENLALAKDKIISAKKLKNEDLKDIELLIMGSPTHAGQPTPTLKNVIANIPENSLKNINVMTFDTSIKSQDKNFLFKTFINMLGYAAKRTAKMLQDKGATIVGSETFFVKDKEGPLEEGEIKRAQDWIKNNYK